MNKLTKAQVISQKSEIMALKKKELKKCATVHVIPIPIKAEQKSSKQFPEDTEDVIYRRLILNTYNYMDSHDDVHVKGIFTKSIKENKGNIPHLHDHIFQLTAKVGKVIDIKEIQMSWRDLGVDIDGVTTVLAMDSEIRRDFNEKIFYQYKNGEINQHSVGMFYIKIDLAVDEPQEEDEFKTFNEFISQLGNPDKAKEQGYFWVIREAKLLEGSAVIAGSNTITPTLGGENKSLLDEIKDNLGEIKNFNDLCTALKSFEPGNFTQKNNKPHDIINQIRNFKYLQK